MNDSCNPFAGWLIGGGEMESRIRAHDWRNSPIGPAASWSPALRNTLRLMLANRFPHILWWGPEHIQFYNDAYIPIPGNKHPKLAFARPGRECWSEIWHIIGPLINTPFRGGPATWNEDILLEVHRHGFLEETHFTIAYSPVPDDNAPGGVGGVLGTIHEITQKVIHERWAAALRDLSNSAFEAKTAEEACAKAAATLSRYGRDVPFALVYLIDAKEKRARFVCGTGELKPGHPLCPAAVDLGVSGQTWPLSDAFRSEGVITVGGLAARFGVLVPSGPWSEPPREAVIVPVRSNIAHGLAGLLVMGVSARLKLDALYHTFYELVASQFAIAIARARALEEERKRAEALAEVDRAKTQFFSNISHEFRTPLTLMLGPLEDALASGGLPPKELESVRTAHRNSQRLSKLVNTLLDFSRVEAGRAKAAYHPADLSAITAGLASTFRSACERAGLSLVVFCPKLPEPVYLDREIWEKIVLNLLSNAFKFTFAGKIEVSCRAQGSFAELVVRDTGIGIPERELPRIFERFHRVENSGGRTHEGTGIGLALVKELVTLQGGTISVASVPGEGTAFTVRLPFGTLHLPQDQTGAAQAQAPAPARAGAYVEEALRWLPEPETAPACDVREPLAAVKSSAADGRPRLLIADDNADMRSYLHAILASRYQVESVADGASALAAIRARRPALAILDVMMPRMDGFMVLGELRKDAALKDLPVILLSARAGEEAEAEGLAAGADGYIVKPFSVRELLVRIQANLSLTSLRQEAAAALRASEERLKRVLETEAVGVLFFDRDGTLTGANDVFLRMTGYAREDVGSGKLHWRTMTPPEWMAASEAELEQLAIGGRIGPYEKECIHKDGSRTWMLFAGRDLGDGSIVEFAIDIDDRKKAEAALWERETQLAIDAAALARLNAASSRLWRTRSLREGLDEMLDASIALLGADKGTIQIMEPGRGILTIAAQRGFSRAYLRHFKTVTAAGDTACGRAVRSAERVMIEDVETDEAFAPYRPIAAASGFRAVQSTPLIARDGTRLGILSTHFRNPHQPSQQDLHRLDLYARQAADFIERCRAEEALRKSEESERQRRHELETTLSAIPAAVLIAEDKDCTRISANSAGLELFRLPAGANTSKSAPETEMPRNFEAFSGTGQALTADQLPLQRVARTGKSIEGGELEVRFTDGERKHLLGNALPLFDPKGEVRGAVGAFLDITERKRQEERIGLLLHEVNHRAKNMLSLVLAVARQTAAGSPDEFLDRFSERIQALATGQDLLVKAEWKGVSLNELVRSQLAHFKDLIGTRIELKGPPLLVMASAAQTLGMAVHELATNAGKYGALSSAEGRVAIAWSLEPADAGAATFTMSWREHEGPPVPPPSRKGFGSAVIGCLAESSLDAKVDLEFARTGLSWHLCCPAREIIEGNVSAQREVPTRMLRASNRTSRG